VKIADTGLELGEIESALAAHPEVASRWPRSTPWERAQLTAYAVPRRAGVRAEALRDHLARSLPEYTRPRRIVLIPEIPLTANGKVNRAALPPRQSERRESGHAVPATADRELVAATWAKSSAEPGYP